ncbi:hypothetical protein GCM10027037_01070 [Mucilaginibacter koreensis]
MLTTLLLKELKLETEITRKMLQCLPDDQFGWKPHTKSMTIQQLVTHITEIPGWPFIVLTTAEIDFANNPHQPVLVNSKAEALEALENYYQKSVPELENTTDEVLLNETWSMRAGDYVIDTLSKYDSIRMSFNQLIHHRAQLSVFLRLLNIPIPGSYGPSADEMEQMFPEMQNS